ncbi:unnamed protein product [Musa hybrid cultivar]
MIATSLWSQTLQSDTTSHGLKPIRVNDTRLLLISISFLLRFLDLGAFSC